MYFINNYQIFDIINQDTSKMHNIFSKYVNIKGLAALQ